jgi:hypothetical protein
MADVAPTTAIDGSTGKFTFGTDTYYGIKNYKWGGRIDKAVEKVSGAAGIVTIVLEGGADDTITFDILVASGGHATINALKRGESSATCTLVVGGVSIDFAEGLIESSDFGGNVGQAGMLSISVSCNGTLTIGAPS